MSKEDADNLKFLLSVDQETLEDWFSKMSTDDHLYALELLIGYLKTLMGAQEMLDNLGL